MTLHYQPLKKYILLSLKQTKEEFKRETLFLSALMLYRKRKLSLGKSAELAGYTKIRFIEKLQQEQDFIFDYTDGEIDEIFDDAEGGEMLVSSTKYDK
jgi:predicted HTH domain antitoxin